MRYMQPPPERPTRPSWPTVAAVIVMFVLCVLAVLSAFDLFRQASTARLEDPFGTYEGDSFVSRFAGVFMLLMTSFIGTCAVAILRLRPWGRDATMYTFVVFALMTGLSFFAAPAGDVDLTFWLIAPAVFIMQVSVVVLLNTKRTREEFYAMEELDMVSRRERRRRAYERDAMRRRRRRERALNDAADIITLPSPEERTSRRNGPDGMGA